MTKLLALALIFYIIYRVLKHVGNIFKTISGDSSEQEYIRQQSQRKQQTTTSQSEKKEQKKSNVVPRDEGEYVDFEEVKEKK